MYCVPPRIAQRICISASLREVLLALLFSHALLEATFGRWLGSTAQQLGSRASCRMSLLDLVGDADRQRDARRACVRQQRAVHESRGRREGHQRGEPKRRRRRSSAAPQAVAASAAIADVWNSGVCVRSREQLDANCHLQAPGPKVDGRTWAAKAILRAVFTEASRTFDFTDTPDLFGRQSKKHALAALRVVADSLLEGQRSGLCKLMEGPSLDWCPR